MSSVLSVHAQQGTGKARPEPVRCASYDSYEYVRVKVTLEGTGAVTVFFFALRPREVDSKRKDIENRMGGRPQIVTTIK